MWRKMDESLKRFHDIIKKSVRRDLLRHIIRGDFLVKPGTKNVVVPWPEKIVLPHFHYGNQGGVSQGNQGPGRGEEETKHFKNSEMPLTDIVDMLGEQLALPNMLPKDKTTGQEEKIKYNSRSLSGPRSLIHKKATLKEALKRMIASGHYNPADPKLIIAPPDRRFRSFRSYPQNADQAVIFFMADISGSVDLAGWEIILIESFWIEQWIKKFYGQRMVMRFLVHDVAAREVPRDDFFSLLPGGSTKFLPAYKLIRSLIQKEYPPELWNIYIFHWTDGDGFKEDEEQTAEFIGQKLLPMVNLLGLEQLLTNIKNGRLPQQILTMRKKSKYRHKIRVSSISDKIKIPRSLQTLLGKR